MDVANGNKLKDITNPDAEPTLADINAAKQQEKAQANASSMAVSSPVANAN